MEGASPEIFRSNQVLLYLTTWAPSTARPCCLGRARPQGSSCYKYDLVIDFFSDLYLKLSPPDLNSF